MIFQRLFAGLFSALVLVSLGAQTAKPRPADTASPSSAMPKLRILFVADGADERADRIAAFLRTSGLAVTVTDYAAVKLADCDAHDVVLADSKRFRESAKGSLISAMTFPKTKTPIVAANFLGTKLIERQGVAMTSGYI